MSVTSWIRRQFKNAVSVTDFIPAGVSSGATSFTAHDGTTFPDGSVGSFIVTLDQGLATEEKVLIASRSGAVFTVAASGRGYNGYAAQTHAANCTILHTIDPQDLDEANQVAVATLGAITATGDLLIGNGANSLTKLARGSNSQFLQTVGSSLQWTSFGSSQSQTVGYVNGDGTQTTPARSDHTHAVALTSAAGHLASDYNTTGSLATFLTTASLAVGTWLITFAGVLSLPSSGGAALEAVVGTATATFEGKTSGQYLNASGSNLQLQDMALSFIATVTVTGTITFQAITEAASPVIKATAPTQGYAKATGYTAVRIA